MRSKSGRARDPFWAAAVADGELMRPLLCGTVTATAVSAVPATLRQRRIRRCPIKHAACHVGLFAPIERRRWQCSTRCNRLGGGAVDALLTARRVVARHQAAVGIVAE